MTRINTWTTSDLSKARKDECSNCGKWSNLKIHGKCTFCGESYEEEAEKLKAHFRSPFKNNYVKN